MTFQAGGNLSSGRVSAGGGRGGLAIGGGLGTLALLLVAVFFGVDPQAILPAIQGSDGSQQNSAAVQDMQERIDRCKNSDSEAANKDPVCRIVATTISVDAIWGEQLPHQADTQYRRPNTIIFDKAVNTACGAASAQTGPFYCSGDNTAYFDLSFFETMLTRLGGVNAPAAQEYVVAHEYGHHVQNVLGWLNQDRMRSSGPGSSQVHVELEADCFAGLWFHYASRPGNQPSDAPMLKPLKDDELQAIRITAQAIGDDAIQEGAGQQVNPESWTHGSSQQRLNAFMTGYTHGSLKKCHALGR